MRADQTLRRDGGGGRGYHDLTAAAHVAADSDYDFRSFKIQFMSNILSYPAPLKKSFGWD